VSRSPASRRGRLARSFREPPGDSRPQVFVSVSKPLSREIGTVLVELAELVLPELRFWFYRNDIQPGENGNRAVDNALLRCDGCICVTTRANSHAQWPVYEAGFMRGASLARGRDPIVVPVLVDADPSVIAAPLDAPQAVNLTKGGLIRLFETIGRLADCPPTRGLVRWRFDRHWTRFRRAFSNIMAGELAENNLAGLPWKYENVSRLSDASGWSGRCQFALSGDDDIPVWRLHGERVYETRDGQRGRLPEAVLWHADLVWCAGGDLFFKYRIRIGAAPVIEGFALLKIAARDKHHRPCRLEGDLVHVSPAVEVTRLTMRRD